MIKKILFISHNATLSGAPLVLLNFIRWLKRENSGVRLDVIFVTGGNYIDEYLKSVDKVYILQYDQKETLVGRTHDFVKRKITDRRVVRQFVKSNYELIYVNTISALGFGTRLKGLKPKTKLLLHVHELEAVTKILNPAFKSQIGMVDLCLSVSKSVSFNLLTNYNIPYDKIKLIHEFINTKSEMSESSFQESTGVFRVGASGFADWRKGYDIFILVASLFKKKYPESKIIFQWVGAVHEHIKVIIDEDIRKLALQETVFFTGRTNRPLDEFKNFDVLLMTSREDPFPLVCMEVGVLGKPVMCFDQAGGTTELIENGGGKIVPYLDIEAMADMLHFYYTHPEEKQKDGAFLSKEVEKYDTNLIAPQLLASIMSLVQ